MKRILLALPVALLAACSSRPVEEVRAEEAGYYRDKGDAAAAAGDFVGAIDHYTESLELNPSVGETWYRRGNAYIKRAPDPDRPNLRREWIQLAEQDYSRAIERNPTLSVAWFNRAMVRLKMKKYQAAANDLLEVTSREAANESSPMLKEAELYLGDIWYKNLDDQQLFALVHYDKYVKLGGDRPDVLKLVREWRELQKSMGSAPPTASPKGPTPEDEAAARQLHLKVLALIPKGEEQRPEVAKLLEELTTKYAQTKYVRDNEKGLKALLNAFKPKEK
ncbi:MAG TPA: tetratricopeptide repeat protein [Planctomycetota bacterium]|nr:tetratricopeptide repeat protein [Planctomycetota bacterium]